MSNKSQKIIVDNVYKRLNKTLTKETIFDIINIVSDFILEKILNLENINIPGLGILYCKYNSENNNVYLPLAKENKHYLPKKMQIKFIPDQKLLDFIKLYSKKEKENESNKFNNNTTS